MADLDGKIDSLLTDIRDDAMERAQRLAERRKRPLTPEEAERAVNEAIGRKTVSRIVREAADEVTGKAAGRLAAGVDRDVERKVLAALKRAEAEQEKLATSLNVRIQRGIERAFAAEKRKDIRDQVRAMANEARAWMDRARRNPESEAFRAELDYTLRVMADHSNLGDVTAKGLREQFAGQLDEDAFKFTADLEKRLADDARQEAARMARETEEARIRGVVEQIDQVLDNPNAPGAAERFAQLQADLAEIGARGFERGSDIRKRLAKQGLIRAGMAGKLDDVEPLVRALSRVDPERPEEMRAVLSILGKNRLIDRVLEFQYVNMLSSPITHAINASSNAMQVAGRLLLQNPAEFLLSGGYNTGGIAAFRGAAAGAREGWAEAKQIMRSGVSQDDVERATELGEWSHVSRELLTEKFGKAGAVLHMVSTRPMEAMDALLGHVAYASAAEQYAQREADRMLARGAEAVKGLSRDDARRVVMANIWDHPEIIQRAGRIKDYTLLRSRDVEGSGWGRVERGLRQLAGVRNPAEDAGAAGQAIAFVANTALPFFQTPLNFAKQGAERTVGVPVNLARGLRAAANGDRERQGELLAKAAIGAAGLTTAGVLVAGDNLTGDGPTDQAQRKVWEMTHRRNSFRAPGTDTWISWEGTPLAIPFAMMAGAAENYREAGKRADKKGLTGTLDAVGSTAIGAGRGAAQGFMSQSFVRALGDQYQLLTGNQTSFGMGAASVAGEVGRFVPGSGFWNFVARVGDDMERDVGRPEALTDVPGNVVDRVKSRVPGLRNQLDEKLDIYGEGVPNEQGFPTGVLPYFRGKAPRAGDAITGQLESKGVGMPSVDNTIPGAGVGLPKTEIPLTPSEQRRYQQLYGQQFRKRLEAVRVGEKDLPAAQIETLRSQALDQAKAMLVREIGAPEARRRVRDGLERKRRAS